MQKGDGDLALVAVPLSTREDFNPVYNARASSKSTHSRRL